MLNRQLKTALLLLPVLLSTEAVWAKKMYRWVNEKGEVYFSDQVPQEEVERERQILDNNARVIDVTEKAKTKEQLEMDRRLEKLRKEQEKIIAKQVSNDKVLLSTFRNMDDMNAALDKKMQAFDAQRRIVDGNLQRLEEQLTHQQEQAATHERNGKAVPPQLVADIAATKEQIRATQAEQARHQNEKEKARREFIGDMARFSFLTRGQTTDRSEAGKSTSTNTGNLLGVFVCQTPEQCDKAWQSAGQFVAKYSTTGPDIETELLIMRASPAKDDDLSLAVSKLKLEDGQQQLFLDIRCRQSSLGNELCASEKAQNLRPAFIQFIQSALTAGQ